MTFSRNGMANSRAGSMPTKRRVAGLSYRVSSVPSSERPEQSGTRYPLQTDGRPALPFPLRVVWFDHRH